MKRYQEESIVNSDKKRMLREDYYEDVDKSREYEEKHKHHFYQEYFMQNQWCKYETDERKKQQRDNSRSFQYNCQSSLCSQSSSSSIDYPFSIKHILQTKKSSEKIDASSPKSYHQHPSSPIFSYTPTQSYETYDKYHKIVLVCN